MLQAAEPLKQIVDDVCPACKAKEVFYCEVVDGVYMHAQSGECKASPILQLLTHLDDIRHQFANEYNENEQPLVQWCIKTGLRPQDVAPEDV